MTDDVAERMRAAVAGVTAPDLLPAVLARRARQRRAAFAGSALAAVVTVAATAVVLANGPGERRGPEPVVPTGARPPLTEVAHSRFDLTYLPPGFAVEHVGFQQQPEGRGETERINVAAPAPSRPGPRPMIILLTMPGDDPVTVDDYRGVERSPREVRVGSRTVVRVRAEATRGGLTIYDWTEEPGLNVSVDARDGVPDAEVRRFVAGLRLRPAAPVVREVYPGPVADPVTVPWYSAVFTGPRTMEVAYLATDSACRVLAAPRVVESATAITVTLAEGTPGDGMDDVGCPPRGVTAKVVVHLAAPRAGRQVYDGSVTPPVPRTSG